MRVTLIHNPSAGDDEQPEIENLRGRIQMAGHVLLPQVADDDDWQAALAQPTDLIAVAGGDGTIGRVGKMLLGRRGIPIAPLPMGTANNIAHTLGVADIPLEQLIDGWQSADKIPFDAGRMTWPGGSGSFIEGIGAGLFAWVMPQADASQTLANLDQADAKIVYALQMLKDRVQHCPAVPVRSVLDGKDISGVYIMFQAMNIQRVGPNLFIAPDANPGDGLLDVILLAEDERAKLWDYLSGWQHDHQLRPDLRYHRGRHLQIDWSGYHLHLDDAMWPGEQSSVTAPARLEIVVEPAALSFLLPRK